MKTSGDSTPFERTAAAKSAQASADTGFDTNHRLAQSGPDSRGDDNSRSKDIDSTAANTLAVVEESLSIKTREVETGSVRVHKVAHTEQIRVPVHTSAHCITVDRVAVDREVDQEFPAREEGDTLIVPVFEYRPVVVQRKKLNWNARLSPWCRKSWLSASAKSKRVLCVYIRVRLPHP